MAYAKETKVESTRSREEIETLLGRAGADAFGYQTDGTKASLAFRLAGRYYRFTLEMPPADRWDFHNYKQGSTTFARRAGVGEKMWEQEKRSRWRALLLVIRAKLEAVELGITTLEDEFLAHTMLRDGRTVGEAVKPDLEEHYRLGGPPRLSLGGPSS